MMQSQRAGAAASAVRSVAACYAVLTPSRLDCAPANSVSNGGTRRCLTRTLLVARGGAYVCLPCGNTSKPKPSQCDQRQQLLYCSMLCSY